VSRGALQGLVRVLAWAAGSSLAGAAIGLTVGFLHAGAVEAPTIVISVLFGNVVGFTAMISSTLLFSRLEGLAPAARALLLGLALISGAAAGSVAVLFAYPLFVVRDPRQAAAIVAINGVLALIVGTIVYGYERMRLRLQQSLREVEEVRLVEARLREEAARAELAALQARINPHFFFNTLNTISSLVAEDPDAAEEVIETLAELFRYTFRVAGAGPVPLRDEIEFTRNYLTVEKARFRERLAVEWRLDHGVLDAPVPGLILQPLVENAVAHGIARRAAGGTVTIVAARIDGRLHVDVLDDGPGLDGSPLTLIRDGHGLGNVEGRLQTFYRGEARLELMRNPAGRGTLARLSLPQAPAQAAPPDRDPLTALAAEPAGGETR
jgi:two-component system sensor histidine kinase AlgZ